MLTFFSQVFKSKVAERFLFLKPGTFVWSIRSDLNSNKMYIQSGSVWTICPASPESKFNEICDIEDWQFNEDTSGEGSDFEEGGIVVSCSTCCLSTA